MDRPPLLLCASTQYWDEAWFRKQHFMHHLARTQDVLYVEPSYSVLRRKPAHLPSGQDNPILRPTLRRREERLWTLTPPRGFPFWTHPLVSGAQYRRYGSLLRAAAEKLGHGPVWLWLYNPLYVQSVPTLRPERLILDLVDELGAYEARSHSRATMRRCLEEALVRSDLVFSTSTRLAAQYAEKTRRSRIEVVSNGVNAEWIDRPAPVPPSDVARLSSPRIGFVGALFSYLDFEIMAAVARAFPSGSLVLVGPELDAAGLARLRSEPNVHFLGRCPQEKVPDYLSSFDVCLCPFRAGEVRRAVNPLKVYEYLAAGKAVVSTRLESLEGEPVARWIRFAEGAEAFVAAVKETLAEETPEKRQARREAMRPYSWDALAREVEGVLGRVAEEWGMPDGSPSVPGGRP